MKTSNRKGLEIGWALAAKRKKPDLTCPICNKVFHRGGNRKTKCKLVCCSRACKAKSQIGKLVKGFNLKPKKGQVITCPVCGKTKQRPPSQTGKFCSRACYEKSPGRWDNIKGQKHYNWKGGITPENQKLRGSIEARKWTLAVFRRDKFKCQICGASYNGLQAHHKFPWSEFSNLRFDVSNGITLCEHCHKFIHWTGRHFTKSINQKLENFHEY